MSRFIFLLITCFTSSGFALAAEVQLSGPEVRALLNDNILYGEDQGQASDQIFQKNGVTYYHIGSGQSQGKWKVDGDKFCSLWPPNPTWVCYDVTRDGRLVVFISKSGMRTEMLLAK